MKKTAGLLVCILALAGVVMCFGCASGGSSASSASSTVAAASATSSTASTAAPGGSASVSGGTASSASSQVSSGTANLENGVYTVKFDTDSSMFHVNESKSGTGDLTVENGKMTVHVSLASKRITNLYVGTAEQAKADDAGVIQPTIDKVTYSDGAEEEVYGFDVPVPALEEEFDVAILGEKGSWYDHKVSVSNPVKQ